MLTIFSVYDGQPLSLPPFLMSDNSSGMNAIVAVIAIIAIVVVGFFAIQMFTGADTNDGASINVDLPTGGGNNNQ